MTIPVNIRLASFARISVAIGVIGIAYFSGQFLCIAALMKLGWWLTPTQSGKGLICALLLLFFVPLLCSMFATRKLRQYSADFRAFSSSRKLVYALLILYLLTCFMGVPAMHARFEERTLPSCYRSEEFRPANARQGGWADCADYIAIPLLPSIIFYYDNHRSGFFFSGRAEVYAWFGIGVEPLYLLDGWIS